MDTIELLEAVLPTEGYYCIVGIKAGSGVKQKFYETLDECRDAVKELVEHKHDAYFACAKYEKHTTRTQDNATYFKAFWLDIDCGPKKDYDTQENALTALKQFCSRLKLPMPTLVNSGRGLHVYWVLNEVISRSEWQPVANRLKQLCEEYELRVDPSRTADAASILRVSGTFNYKDEPPKQVIILGKGLPVSYADFRDTLGVLEAPPESGIPRNDINELTKHLSGNQENWFKEIVKRTMKGDGCAQIEHILLNQETVDYNLWRAGLSVAWACEDRDQAIHKISQGHPDYSFESTIRKAADTGGPQRCETFAKWNPEGCASCPHKGKIPGPIALGKRIPKNGTPPEPVKENSTNAAPAAPPLISGNYPYPYFRGKNGGVYKEVPDDDPVCVYQHDLEVVKRLTDPLRGEVIWLRLVLPRDGLKEFALPLTELLTKDKLRERLAFHGVSALQKQMDNIMFYINACVNELQFKTQLEVMRMQFGWAEKNSKFILGEQEITASGIRYSPPSAATAPLAEYMNPQGTLEEWQRIVHTYNREGFEPHAFGFFTAFGSVLLPHLDLRGAVINMINNKSGTGKTTIAKAMHSVYGHPEEQMMIARDTMNMKLNRLGIMNNLPASVDEVTNMDPKDVSDLLYAVSQGRARGRMQAHVNAERLNTSKWGLICLMTSNASFYDKLTTLKNAPDGEMMRLIEYQIPETTIISKEEAGNIFPNLAQNYGHAGRIYLQWLVGNLEFAIDMVKQVQVTIDKDVGFTGRERFWSGVAACNIAGAMMANRIGIIDFDIRRVYRWLIAEFRKLRVETKPPATNHSSAIAEFLDTHRDSILVINDEADKRTGMEQLPIVEPRFQLLVRFEPDTKKMFINAGALRKYCSDRQITLKDVLSALSLEGVYGGTIKKRLGKGTKIPGASVYAHVFDCAKGDFIDAEHYAKPEETQEDEGTGA